MAKMLVALAVVMMHGVMAKRSNTWLADAKHLSVREQSEEEPSMDEKSPIDDDMEQQRRWEAILEKPLDVSASAVAFCAELFKEAQTGADKRFGYVKAKNIMPKHMQQSGFAGSTKQEATAAEAICPKVLTGSLGDADPNATEWAKKAVKVAQLDGEEHDFGRLDNVPWRYSLHRVCHDECHALVQRIKDRAQHMQADFDGLVDGTHSGDYEYFDPETDYFDDYFDDKADSLEEICANRVVKQVESEIMTCCARSCGWNNHSCMFWPLMTSKEQADWESECCAEMNILQGSTRERLCDSTLSKHDKEESYDIIDKRPNTEVDREILGQDGDVSVASSFMETSSMGSFNGQCPPPLNLDQLHANWATDWTVMNLMDLKSPTGQKVSTCAINKETQPTINGCKVFLLLQLETEETNSEEKPRTFDYKCLDDCHMQKPPPKKVRAIIDKESSSSNGIVYIHKDKFPKST